MPPPPHITGLTLGGWSTIPRASLSCPTSESPAKPSALLSKLIWNPAVSHHLPSHCHPSPTGLSADLSTFTFVLLQSVVNRAAQAKLEKELKKQDWYPNRKMSRSLDRVLQKKNIHMTIKQEKKWILRSINLQTQRVFLLKTLPSHRAKANRFTMVCLPGPPWPDSPLPPKHLLLLGFLAHSAPDSEVPLLVPRHAKHALTSGPWNLMFPVSRTLCLQHPLAHCLTYSLY